ncbi:MAG: aldo/keto reductase [Phycisphaerales bacterium JB038]
MNVTESTTRRSFVLGAAGLAVAGPSLGRAAQEEPQTPPAEKMLPTIDFGNTGRLLPRLGLGTYFLSTLPDAEKGIAVVRRAIEVGVRYFDTAPSYSGGKAEERVGIALEGEKREDFFIATKTLQRSADGARREIEESLKRLKTDYVDSLQLHAIKEDYQKLFGDNDLIAGLTRAKEEGLIRHLGITAHLNPTYLIEACKQHDFFSALVPVNPIDTKRHSFIRQFLPFAIKQNIAVVAMKIYAAGVLLRTLTVDECVHYALSQPGVDIIVPGCQEISHVEGAYAATLSCEPLSQEAQLALEEKAGPHEGKSSEWYKDTK